MAYSNIARYGARYGGGIFGKTFRLVFRYFSFFFVIIFILNISAGESLPDHTHYDSTVLLQVINGTARLIIDEESINIQENDLIKIDGPETMSVHNTGGENLVLYVTISPLPADEKYAQNADF